MEIDGAVTMKVVSALALIVSCVCATQVNARDYKLAVGDQVLINVYEWPDLSGDYRISPDGTVVIRLIGEVTAEGLTPAALAGMISERVGRETGVDEPPNATVEVMEYRPFYILGDVQQPGEYAYRFGLTVLQATAIAGGMHRIGGASPQHHRNAVVSRGELAILGLEIDQLIARSTRLDAELNGRDTLEFPPSFSARSDEAYTRRLIEEEELLFEANRTQYAERLKVLTGLQKFYEAEAKALSEQSEDANRQIASAEQQLEGVASLVSRGLAPSPRQFDMERTVAGIVANQRQLETNVLRANQSVAETKQRLLDLRWERRNKVLAESQQTEAGLEAARQRVITTQALILEAEIEAPNTLERQRKQIAASVREYEIVRNEGSDAVNIVVDEHEMIEPGDVIMVRRVFAVTPRF